MYNKRFHSLDSLRGLASLQVVIGHCFMVSPVTMWLMGYNKPGASVVHDVKFKIANSPLHLIWHSGAAVLLFFVLSGFVLSLPYYKADEPSPNYFKFIVKRILRLYLPCLAIIIISLGLKNVLFVPGKVNMFDTWIKNEMWILVRGPHEFVDLFLLNTYFNDIDPALWTLPIELKLSLILPFFIFIQKRANLFWSIALVIGCAIFYHSLNHLGARKLWADLVIFYYFTFFALGCLICKYRASMIGFINDLNVGAYLSAVVCAVLVYTYNYTFWWLPKLVNLLDKAQDYVYGLAGAMFILIALSTRAYSIFNSKLFIFFGKISFSLYLVHQVFITALAYILSPYVDPIIIIVLGFGVSILLGLLYYHLVELSSLNLANFVSRKVFGWFYKKERVTHTI